MVGWVTRKEMNVFSMMAGWFSNGGLQNSFLQIVLFSFFEINGGLGMAGSITLTLFGCLSVRLSVFLMSFSPYNRTPL